MNLFAVLFRFLCLFSRLVQTTYQIDYNTIEFRRNVCFFSLLLVKYHLCLVYFEKLNFSGKNNGSLYFRWFGKSNLMVTFGCNHLIRFIFHCLCNFSSFRETCMYTSYPWSNPYSVLLCNIRFSCPVCVPNRDAFILSNVFEN